MPKDYANIYNLSDEDRKAEIKNMWDNSIPGAEELAKGLLRKIEEDEYPYVLSVEASYGMGKTYFFSRFCEYAKKNGYNCVYISAWENDYQPTPFCFITKEILDYLEKSTKPAIKSKIDELLQKGTKAVKDLLLASHIQLGITGDVTSASIGATLEKLCQSFIEPKDEIKEFKKELEQILVSNKIEPLILVIDELDRCKPDYALKTLEIIKHFFDVENLYVILPINKKAITDMVTATYGNIDNPEIYLRKLITETYILPTPSKNSYKKIIENQITKRKLKVQIEKKYIEENDNFNGYNTIISTLTKYAFNGKLTYRELLKVCRELLCIGRKIEDKILVEYLAYKLCNRYKDVELDENHPFCRGRSYALPVRSSITNIKNISTLTYNLHMHLNNNSWEEDYSSIVSQWETRNEHFETYRQFYGYIDNALKYKDAILSHQIRTLDGKEKFIKFFDSLENAKKNALSYQNKYGSDDDDTKNQAFYDRIIEDTLCLYEDNKSQNT